MHKLYPECIGAGRKDGDVLAVVIGWVKRVRDWESYDNSMCKQQMIQG
jgi:hypothetical protein